MKLVYETHLCDDYILSLDASPKDDNILALGCMDGTVRLFHLQQRREVRSYPTAYGPAWSVGFSPSGELLAIGSTRYVRVIEPVSGAVLADLDKLNNDVFGVAFSGDEKLLAVCCHDANLRVYTVRPLDVHERILTSSWSLLQKICCGRQTSRTSFRSDKRTVVFGCDDGTLRWLDGWNARHAGEVFRPHAYPMVVCCAGELDWCGWTDGRVSAYHNGDERHSFSVSDWNVMSLHVLADRVIAADAEGHLCLHSLEGRPLERQEHAHEATITAVRAVSGYVASVGWDGYLRLWRADSETLV